MVQLEVFIGKLVTIDRLSSCTYYIHKNETQWHETGIIVFVSMSSLSFSIYTSTNMTSMYLNRHHKQKTREIILYLPLWLVKSPPWHMKPGMTRWKDDPAYPNPFSPRSRRMKYRRCTLCEREFLHKIHVLRVNWNNTMHINIFPTRIVPPPPYCITPLKQIRQTKINTSN